MGHSTTKIRGQDSKWAPWWAPWWVLVGPLVGPLVDLSGPPGGPPGIEWAPWWAPWYSKCYIGSNPNHLTNACPQKGKHKQNALKLAVNSNFMTLYESSFTIQQSQSIALNA